MALIDRGAKPKSDIPTSAMADIAFLLLIFFLVTTVFPKDQGLGVVLAEQNVTQPVPPKNVFHLLILETGVVEVRRGDSQHSQLVSTDRIEAIWRQAVAENPRLIAAVKTHPDAAYMHMIDVLDGLQSAGAQRFALQLLER